MLHSKKDYEACLKKIILPLKKYFTFGKAGIKCGNTGVHYKEKTALTEAFARPLWGLAPLWGGNGELEDFDKIYLEGIKNGTNPNHKEYWGEITSCTQEVVETAAIGLSLILAPQKVWEPLSEIEKDNFYNWLSGINKITVWDNNWQFFPVMVNLGFKSIGREYDKNVIEKAFEKIDTFYLGNGWYTDGYNTQSDYYIPFAIHFYSLIYAKVMEKEDPENSQKFKKRAEKFAKDFIYWFDDNGSALPFGRSLTYRFAQCCFWSACVFADVKPFSMGVMKGIISRHLEYWMSLPIFDNDGVLTVGYGYPNLYMSEDYNAFGSPYWALKSFLVLFLDENHEFFKVCEEPLPKMENLKIIPEAKMVIQRINGYVVALTAGQWANFLPTHTPEKYSKFAYSTKFAFCVPRSYFNFSEAGTDSMLTFVKEDMCFVRKKCKNYEITSDGTVISEWSPFVGVFVKMKITPTKDGHIREHTINCEEDCIAYDCGFATPNEENDVFGEKGNVETTSFVNTNLLNFNTYMKSVKYNLKKGINKITTVVVYPK